VNRGITVTRSVKTTIFSLLLGLNISNFGCSGTEFSKLKSVGGSILSSTGVVSSSTADSLFESGAKLQKGFSGFTEKEEYYLGRSVAALILSKYKPLHDAALTSYVNQVGSVLVLGSVRPYTYGGYHFLVLDTNEVNAISAPGGLIFISKGFIKALPDEDALAAVLAHEIGHVVLGHARESISQANISDALLSAAKETAQSQGGYYTSELTSLLGDSVKEIGDKLLVNGFSRSQEYEADEFAVGLLNSVGYDASAMHSVVKILEGLEKSSSGGWLSTHPEAEDRLDEFDLEDMQKSPGALTRSVRQPRFEQAIRQIPLK
jgi:predicted Zn-dependent protease